MKDFKKQFDECRRDGYTGKGEEVSGEENPVMFRSNGTVRKLNKIACLRFGGTCESSHEQCIQMRSMS